MLRHCRSISLILLSCYFSTAEAQHGNAVRQKIAQIAQGVKANIGVGVMDLNTGDTLSFHGNGHFVMHSTAKFPIAMRILHDVDNGKLSLNQTIHITKQDLPKTYSPLGDKYPDGNVDIPVKDLLSYMVSLSDNNGCDILLKQLGGPKKVNHYLHHLGIKQMTINASEQQMQAEWVAQYTNWCTPVDMVNLLNICFRGTALSKTSSDYLYKIMLATSTGPMRIKGFLPKGTPVAHKTGTSPTNTNGLSPATNDIGVVTLPNGHQIAMAIFITDDYGDNTNIRESIIARIAKVIWDDEISKGRS